MTQKIQKAVVLGAGTMGARIAAHFANAGLPCLLLDIVPKNAAPRERNKIVAAGLEAAKELGFHITASDVVNRIANVMKRFDRLE